MRGRTMLQTLSGKDEENETLIVVALDLPR